VHTDERGLTWRSLLEALDGELASGGEMVEQHCLFRGEVTKHGAPADAGRGCDLINRRFGVPLADEELEGRVGDTVTGLPGPTITYRCLSHGNGW
jgi:hypothetical protein